MLRWLWRLLGLLPGTKEVAEDLASDVYRPKKRRIYSYWDGTKMVKADPMPLINQVWDNSVAIDQDSKLARSAHKDAGKGHERLIQLLREIFSIPSFADGGLADLEVSELFDHFLTYVEGQKKSTSPSSTSSGTSEDSTSSSEESPPMSNSSDSGSTGSDPSINRPEPSASESESPSDSSSPETSFTSPPPVEQERPPT